MGNLFTGELLKMLGILGLGGLSIMAITGRLIGKIRGSFQPYLKACVIYLLVASVLFALVGFVGIGSLFFYPLRAYIGLQLIFILLGALHIYYLPKIMDWATDEKAFLMVLLFTVAIAAFGFMFFVVIFKWMNNDGYHYIAGSAALFFIFPLFVHETFLKAVAISPKIFTEWYYPVNQEVLEPDDDKLKNMLVISFEFQKKLNDKHFTNFRAKAPRDMEFGQLFYYFINDYSERHPNSKIEIADKNMDPYGWIFYKKPRWYTINTVYISSEKTFYANRIKENEVIVCRRSINM
jgi:Type VI secretion system, TssN